MERLFVAMRALLSGIWGTRNGRIMGFWGVMGELPGGGNWGDYGSGSAGRASIWTLTMLPVELKWEVFGVLGGVKRWLSGGQQMAVSGEH